jgi:hypothetical protein
VGRSPKQHGWWWVDRDGHLDPAMTGLRGDGSRSRGEDNKEEETED